MRAALPPSPADSRAASHGTAQPSCCLRQVAEWVYYGMLREDDTFDETVRKGGVCIGIATGTLVPVAMASELSSAGAGTPAAVAYIAAGTLNSVCCIATYGLVRADLVRSRPAMSFLTAVQLLTLFGAALGSTTYPVFAASMLVMFAAAMMNLPKRFLWFIACAPPYALSAYNHSARALEYDHPALLLEGASSERPLHARLAPFVVVYAFSVMCSWVFYLMHDEYARRIERSRASASLGSLVADRLAKYDTESARWLLQAASAAAPVNGGADPTRSSATEAAVADTVRGADDNFVASLETIVANLEAYRPHLPNWMLDAALADRDQPTGQAGDVRSRAYGFGESASTVDGVDTASTLSRSGRSDDNRGVHTDSRPSIRRPRPDRSVPHNKSEDVLLPGLLSDADLGNGKSATLSHAPAETTRRVHVARARLHFRVERAVRDGTDDGVDRRRSRAAAATAFVDAVFAAARQTKAAVHSFIGDTVEVSWNAASGVTASGLKAARFLARVQQAVSRLNDTPATQGADDLEARPPPAVVRVRGGAVACKGTIQTAGSGLQKAVLLSIAARDTHKLTTLANGFADDADTMLVSASVASDAFGVDVCPVATYLRTTGTAAEPAFLVVGEAPADVPDDWLFVPSQAGLGDAAGAIRRRPDEQLCTTVRTAFEDATERGDVAAARESLVAVVNRLDADLPRHVRVPLQRLAAALTATDEAASDRRPATDEVVSRLQL